MLIPFKLQFLSYLLCGVKWTIYQGDTHLLYNFQTDWNDGLAASSLVKAKGGPVPNFREMDNYPENWTSNLEMAINGGNKIGVPEVLQPKDMANPNVEYLGVMAWVAQFQWIPDKTPPSERMEMRCNVSKVKVGEEVSTVTKVIEFIRLFMRRQKTRNRLHCMSKTCVYIYGYISTLLRKA